MEDNNTKTISGIRIGWVGAGVMGLSMCGHLLKAEYPLTVHTRTSAKAKPLLDRGAAWADSPKETAENSDVIFTMVGFPQDVRDVYFGQSGILSGIKKGGTLIDMTTTSPNLARQIYDEATPKGVFSLDAPVSGGDVGARNATLSIMVGGDQETYNRILPLLQLLGSNIVYQGSPGSGQHTKMCNQIVIAGSMIGVCESLLYGFKAGLNMETVLQSIGSGAAGCWSLNNLAPRILRRDFDPGFFVEHFIKDMGIALEESKRMGLCLPGLALAHQLYISVQALGHGRCGTQALILALESMANISVE